MFFLTYGKVNNLVQSQGSVKAWIRNSSVGALTNVSVSLDITGANSHSDVQVISSIDAGDTVELTFSGIPINASGNQNIQISLPADDNLNNNTLVHLQSISCDTLAFTNISAATSAVGFNTGGGILANRYQLPSGIPLTIESAGVWLSDEVAVAGNQMRAVICNSQGIQVDSSFIFTITSNMLGNRLVFPFFNSSVDYSGQDIYVGIRQYPNAALGYFPVATQAAPFTPSNSFYSLTNAGDTTSYTSLGLFMIEAVVKTNTGLTNNSSGGQVCTGATVDYMSAVGFDNYNFSVDASSVQNGTGSTYSFIPVDNQTVELTVTKNTCVISSGL